MATGSSIRSDQISGTDVYGAADEKVGTIDHLVIEKKSGRVIYVVMHFGGFLGLGEKSFPVPWNALTYDTHLEGFRTAITEDQLANAPTFDENQGYDRTYERRLHDHYGTPYYW